MHAIYENPLPGGWSEEPLGVLVETKRGCSWTKDEERSQPETDTIPVVRIPNIQQRLDLSGLLHLHGVTVEQRESSAVTKGWTLMVGSNGNPKRIGDSVLMDEDREMVFASFLLALRPKLEPLKITDDFLACWLRGHRVHEFISETSQMTTGLANIAWNACRKLPVRFPSDPAEQTRIAETLKAADEHIRAIEMKIRKAERVFRALLNDLFNGLRAAPKIKGRQCFTLHGHVNFDEKIVFTDEGETAYFKVDDFNSVGNERQLVNAAARVAVGVGSKSVPFEAGNVLFAKRGAALTKNRVRINAVPCFLDPNLMLMRVIPGVVEAPYLRYYLMFFRLEKLGEDAGIPQLNNKDLYPKEFPIPEKSVRESICKALSAAEDLVDAVNHQLAAARRVKQSLLQNLLTGKIRLKA